MTNEGKERTLAIILGTIFVSLFTASMYFIAVTTSNPVIHLVKIQEENQMKYAIESCHKSNCKFYGYRWEVTEDGLKLAEQTYSYFTEPNQRSVVAVIE